MVFAPIFEQHYNMTDIIDNRDELLAEHVCKILQQTESVKFAVGYLFVSGLQEIRQQLTHISAIRLLIGNQYNQETIDALMQREMHTQRVQSAIGKLQSPKEKKRITEETGKGIREALSVPPLTDETEKLLAEIKEWLASGKLEVRVLAPQTVACQPRRRRKSARGISSTSAEIHLKHNGDGKRVG